jgi:hypothetical protein
MTRELRESELEPPSPSVQKAIAAFRIWGWGGFWVQMVLGVISGILLIQLLFVRRVNPNITIPGLTGLNVGVDTSPATLPGLGLAWIGLAIVAASVLWNLRYTFISKKLRSADRPSRSQTILQLKIGLILSLVGMFISILATGAIVGALTVRLQQGVFGGSGGFNLTVQPLDFQIIQASLNTILAHFIGLFVSLGLLNQLGDRP